MKLTQCIQPGFSNTKNNLPLELCGFWMICHLLSMMDKVNIYRDNERELHHESLQPKSNLNNNVSKIIIPSTLRTEVVRVLHSAHQGVTATSEQKQLYNGWE